MEDKNVVELNEEVKTGKVGIKEKISIGWRKAKPVVYGVAIGAVALLALGVLKALGDDSEENDLEGQQILDALSKDYSDEEIANGVDETK